MVSTKKRLSARESINLPVWTLERQKAHLLGGVVKADVETLLSDDSANVGPQVV